MIGSGLAMAAALTACGGNGEGGSEEAKNAPLQRAPSGQGISSTDWAQQIKARCSSVHDDSDNFLWCAAGTYNGTDITTGRSCSAQLTADGYVVFANGNVRDSFSLDGGSTFRYAEYPFSNDWSLTIKGANFTQLKKFELSIDTRSSLQMRIWQYSKSLLGSDKLNATCAIPF